MPKFADGDHLHYSISSQIENLATAECLFSSWRRCGLSFHIIAIVPLPAPSSSSNHPNFQEFLPRNPPGSRFSDRFLMTGSWTGSGPRKQCRMLRLFPRIFPAPLTIYACASQEFFKIDLRFFSCGAIATTSQVLPKIPRPRLASPRLGPMLPSRFRFRISPFGMLSAMIMM